MHMIIWGRHVARSSSVLEPNVILMNLLYFIKYRYYVYVCLFFSFVFTEMSLTYKKILKQCPFHPAWNLCDSVKDIFRARQCQRQPCYVIQGFCPLHLHWSAHRLLFGPSLWNLQCLQSCWTRKSWLHCSERGLP